MRAKNMWKSLLLLLCLSGYCCAVPLGGSKRNIPIIMRDREPMIMEAAASQEIDAEKPAPEPIAPEMHLPATLTLPSNATSIRADITDNFSCDNKAYGYYADVDNDCQIFHVCLPVTYADGKENTFRWSFICPEETIFSQDSFTCMRREDMAIDCEDSVNYYELNQNFGMTDEDKNSNAPATGEQQGSSSQIDEQQQPEEQQQSGNEESAQAAIASAPQPKPKPMQQKPAKAPKPNRRKPQPKPQSAAINPTNKLPPITPLRKMPQVSPIAPAAVPSQQAVEVAPVEKEKVKPLTQRIKTRPSATLSANQEKVQPVKTESTVENVDSYKRKRPTYPTNVKDAVVTKVDAEPIVQVTQSVSSSQPFVPAVKFDTPVAAVPAVHLPVPVPEKVLKPVEQVPVEVSNAVKTVPEADVVPQASETAEVVVKPEGILKTTAEQTNKNEQTETEPANETDATSEAASETEEVKKPEENEPMAPAAPAVEDEKPEESASLQPEKEAPKLEVNQAPLEAVEEIPAVILETEPIQAAEPAEPESNVKTGAALEDENPAQEAELSPPVSDEAEKKPAESADVPADPQPAAETLAAAEPQPEPEIEPAAPAIFEENSEESAPAAPTLEELEEAKPVDAIEIVPATPDMEQQDPMVQQMFEDNSEHMQSVGGFKPVDPELAAEAEALITDFLNTLKSDAAHARPILPIPMAEEIPAASAENEDTKDEINEETEKTENEEAKPELKPGAVNEPETETSALKTAAVEEAAKVPEPESEENGAPLSNVLMMNSFPGDMYQIPVKVIQTPIEMAQKAEAAKNEAAESAPVSEVKPKAESESEPEPEQQPAKEAELEKVAYRPISIDDIVELVKERLDQVPANEKGAPMELVMEPMLDEQKPAAPQLEQLKSVAEQNSAEPTSAEDIIFPIYHRVSEANSNLVKSDVQAVEEPVMVEQMPAVVVEQKPLEQQEAEKDLPQPAPLTAEKSVQTVDAQADLETERVVVPVVPEARNKVNRIYRSRSLTKAKMDPRKRRFLFKSDAS